MDKKQTTFALKSFKMNLEILDSFATFKKLLSNMRTMVPKTIQDRLEFEKLEPNFQKFAGSKDDKSLPNAIDHFTKWADKALATIAPLADEEFVSKRGKESVENLEVELFGTKALTPVHANNLLKGSELGKYCQTGMPKDFAQWKELDQVLNMISKTIKQVVPESVRNEWKATRKANKAEAKAEENAEPVTA